MFIYYEEGDLGLVQIPNPITALKQAVPPLFSIGSEDNPSPLTCCDGWPWPRDAEIGQHLICPFKVGSLGEGVGDKILLFLRLL